MKRRSQAGISALIGALVLGGGYIGADGADIVPGFFTFDKPLPRVQPFPTPKAVSPAPNEAPQFESVSDLDPDFFKKLTKSFTSDYRMKDAKVSWWIGDLKGIELASANPELALSSASTTKLLTAAAALHDFGSEARARTLVAWDEKTRRLFLIGGGDILLGTGADSSKDVFGYAGLGTLAADTVKALTADSKNALADAPFTLVVDTSWFGEEIISNAWRPQDVQWVGPIQGLGIDTGLIERGKAGYLDDAAGRVGEIFAARLGEAGAAPAKLEAGNSGLATTEFLDPAQPLPELVKGKEVSSAKGQPVVVALSEGSPFSQVARDMLKVSDNTLAENFGRLVALHRGAKPTFAAAGQEVMKAVEELGVKLGETKLAGCSGLAHGTRIPARVLADVVRTAASPDHPELRPLLANLPVAGADGTLKDSYGNTAAAGNLRGKTGTLSVSNSLAGTLVYHNQVLAYALVISGYTEGNSGQTIPAKQLFFAGLLGGKTDFSPTNPAATTTPSPSSSS